MNAQVVDVQPTGYGQTWVTIRTADGRTVTAGGYGERAAYLNAIRRAKDNTPAPAG